MLLQEEADSIVADTVMDSSVGAAAKIIKDSLRKDEPVTKETESQFYPYPNELTQEKLSKDIPVPLQTFLDMICTKSRSDRAEKKKELRRIAVAHALMQFTKKKASYHLCC